MATAHDVAAYIRQRQGSMSAMKLQKLVYYCQAWHLVWDDEPLFPERIEAWANGPVVRELFDRHRGRFTVQPPWDCGSPGALTESERETIDVVLAHYGGIDGRRLSHLTHAEGPWRRARGDIGPTARSSSEITPASLAEYYGSLDTSEDAVDVDDIDWTDSIDG